MLTEELVFGSSNMFEVMAVQRMNDKVVLSVQSITKFCPCPGCDISSNKLHSYYYREIKDLPAFNHKVCLHVRARKWYCLNMDCNRKIFTERFEHHFKRYKRTSDRLREKLLKIALMVGGNPGQRLCYTLNIITSSSTLIRLIHGQDVPAPAIAHAVGIDDWAFKKGINYGTAIVDLEQHRIVDLLPDREALTIENWFKARPEVAVVTRDRFSRYAAGVTNGAPDAIQVADRWHLLKNMGDALHKLLERKRQQIIALQIQDDAQVPENDQVEPSDHQKQEQNLSPRHLLLQQVTKMYAEGKGLKTIARTLGISRNTARKYIHLHEPPQKKGIKTTNLTSFSEYLQTRMQENAEVETIQLFQEIKAMGYNGGRSILYSYLKKYSKQRNRTRLMKLPAVSWRTAKVKVLLCKKDELLQEKDLELVRDICEKSAEIDRARQLANKFREIMDNKHGHLLTHWISEVEQSCVQEMKGFARGLLSDYEAVVNALTLPWSNGQVEGQINKLKTIKRQMYGRAGFELLRKRVILHSAYYHQN